MSQIEPDEEHRILPAERLRYPGGKNGLWIVRCSCGYSSSPSGTPDSAGKPAMEHVASKEKP